MWINSSDLHLEIINKKLNTILRSHVTKVEITIESTFLRFIFCHFAFIKIKRSGAGGGGGGGVKKYFFILFF